MPADLGSFFSTQSQEDQKKTQDRINNAPSERGNRKLEYPGSYVVKVGEFVWWDKKIKEHPIATPSPEVKISRKNALLLNISLQVCDKGTSVVPPGSSIFHTITLLPAKGADEKKFDNTLRFMKPQMTALLGHDKIEITEAWLKENCEIEFEEKQGKAVITKHHKMLKQVYATVDFVPDQNGKAKLKVVKLDKLMPGDKSVTRKYTEEELSKMNTAPTDDVPADIDISPSEEGETKKTTTPHLDTSKVTGVTEEEF